MDSAQALLSAEGKIGGRALASGHRAPGVEDPARAISKAFLVIGLAVFVVSCSVLSGSYESIENIVRSSFCLYSGKILREHISDDIVTSETIESTPITAFLIDNGLYVDDINDWILSTEYHLSRKGRIGGERIKTFPGKDYSIAFVIVMALHNFNEDDYDREWTRREIELIRNASLEQIRQVTDRLTIKYEGMCQEIRMQEDEGRMFLTLPPDTPSDTTTPSQPPEPTQ